MALKADLVLSEVNECESGHVLLHWLLCASRQFLKKYPVTGATRLMSNVPPTLNPELNLTKSL